MNPVTLELILYVASGSLLLAFGGILWAWGWALTRIWKGRGLLENVSALALRDAPWGGLTVFAVVVLYVIVNISIGRGYAAVTGRRPPRLAAKAAQAQAEVGKPEKEPAAKGQAKEPAADAAAQPADEKEQPEPNEADLKKNEAPVQTDAELLIQLALINTLLLVLVPALVRLTSGAHLADFGLGSTNWAGQMAVGGVAALLMTPAVLAVQYLAVQLWPPNKHPVEEMMLGEFTEGVAVLAIMSTMVLAPMVEELLFRGIIQRWLTKIFTGGPPKALPTVNPAYLYDEADWFAGDPFARPVEDPVRDLAVSKGPPTPSSPRFSVAAIVLTSVFFSAMHFPQWPAPIGIFLLSMALGTVYQKTGSLLSAITMHAVFNGFSTVALLVMAIENQLHPPQAGAVHAFLSYLMILQ